MMPIGMVFRCSRAHDEPPAGVVVGRGWASCSRRPARVSLVWIERPGVPIELGAVRR